MIPKLNRTFFIEQLKYWGPTIAWAILIFQASGDRDSVLHSSRIIEPFFRWLLPDITFSQLETIKIIARKGAHMTEFALLALLFLRALSHNRGDARKWISSAWVLSTAYAASDEFHQFFVPGRSGRIADVVIDSAGAALGLWLCFLVLRARSHNVVPRKQALSAPRKPASTPSPRPCFADRLLCTLQGEDAESRSQVHLAVQDRLQRENGGRIILGRNSTTAHLCVKNTSISGQHLSLIFHNGKFEIEDLNSSNGTRVNGRKLVPFRPEPIADGDRIEAGEILFQFRQLS